MEIIAENLTKYQENQRLNRFEVTDRNFLESLELANMLIPHSKETIKYLEDSLANEEIINNSATPKLDLPKLDLPKLDLQELDIKEIINNLLDINQGLISKNQIIIKTEIAKNIPKFRTDIIKFKQILTNLLTNAFKYSHNGSEVQIIAKNINDKIGDGLYIEVADSGIGMNDEELSMALNGDGKKIDKSGLDKEIDSNGIGMTIIKDLVALLGGKMKIESQKGIGTKVGLLFSGFGISV